VLTIGTFLFSYNVSRVPYEIGLCARRLRNLNQFEEYFTKMVAMSEDVKTLVSRYMSYLLRHNPEDLKMDNEGFIRIDELLSKVKTQYSMVDRKLLMSIVHESDKKRFEISGDKIRALYGHTIDVNVILREDKQVMVLYHGTTPRVVREIMKIGLKPMRRRWVHLSPTKEIAFEVGKRRTRTPVILVIDVLEARSDGIKFYKATDKVHLCQYVPAKYIRMCALRAREN
jgi:putative RNA 2'-phosphotransferase